MTVILAKWTIEEYHQMIEKGIFDNRRVELLKGEIVEMSPEGEPHAYFSTEAVEYLIQLLFPIIPNPNPILRLYKL